MVNGAQGQDPEPRVQAMQVTLKPSLLSSTHSLKRDQDHQIKYYITKRNFLSLRLLAVALSTLGWVIMLVACMCPKWVILGPSKRDLWKNKSLIFGLWDNCVHCWRPNQLSIHLLVSRGSMFLNLVFTSLLILSMLCSFHRIFSRISKLDVIFCIMNYISGLALFLCVLFFGLQLLDIFTQERRTFNIKWPPFVSIFGVLSFLLAGTICLNSRKNSWEVSFFLPGSQPIKIKTLVKSGKLVETSFYSILSQLTFSSGAFPETSGISAILIPGLPGKSHPPPETAQ
ncbi:transmembrane protein 225B isoform X2 [Monodelphis domestica]|uniref:transmembrane protein 225B isoform X2 n=1 Tax=Monodelphis domestica TaxID=13616 RepID=UPI0024E24D23|nr:transmembrane protein 225B isoform X2 [Monodelphis domestica]